MYDYFVEGYFAVLYY